MLSQLINLHSIGEQKRKAFKNLKPGESYNQAKQFYNARKNSLEMEIQEVNKIKINQAIRDSLKWNREIIKSKSPASSRLRRSHDKLLSKKEQFHRSLRSLSNASHGVDSNKLITVKKSRRSVKFSVHSSRLSLQSLPRNETNGCHNAQRKSHHSRGSTKSQQSQKSKGSSKLEYYHNLRQKNLDFSFSNQKEIDNFNNLRWGYKSYLKGFGEEHLFQSMRTLYNLENEVEQTKQQLIVDCPDFSIDQGYKLF